MADTTKGKSSSKRSHYPTEWEFRPFIGRLPRKKDGSKKTILQLLSSSLKKGFARQRRTGFLPGERGAYRRSPLSFMQRVVVKARVVPHSRKGGRASLRAHIMYVQREGAAGAGKQVQVIGEKGALSKEESLRICKEWGSDRHHFRFIISPEKGDQLNLEAFASTLVSRMEQDLNTSLQYLFACHYNTGIPHAHLIVRGKTEDGKDLVISKDYISRGIRYLAQEIVTMELGPRNKVDIELSLWKEVAEERFTGMDKELLKEAARDVLGKIRLNVSGREAREVFWKKERLKLLRELGLATEEKSGIWVLESSLEEQLRGRGERKDIIKTMHKRLKEGESLDIRFFDAEKVPGRELVGEVEEIGVQDELYDKRYVIVRADDGNAYHVSLPDQENNLNVNVGSIIKVFAREAMKAVGPADRNILYVARKHGGVYREDFHREILVEQQKFRTQEALSSYLLSHRRRLETLSARKLIEKIGNDAWRVPENLEENLMQLGQGRKGRIRPEVGVLSVESLESQVTALGPTWLDVELEKGLMRSKENEAAFAADKRKALSARISVLRERGVVGRDEFCTNAEALSRLKQVELRALKERVGRRYGRLVEGEKVTGRYVGNESTSFGRLAIVSDGKRSALLNLRSRFAELSFGDEVSVYAATLSTLTNDNSGPQREMKRHG